ncbi:tRNA (N(6)-L-threonylcarbamoyladenosine(37)-C(2))-methylthiotransferase MtaB [Erysipelotrichaceae bacterium RD49]|nr:tRNA (N(6)-L-threonylcarbamoyladenosine(37)-C(2))-methylthiotransferase MtaB [Erysipelotrichaceae bacterium RD49]
MKTFEIETLGCKVNEYESAFYASQLEKAGFCHAAKGEAADVLIINTCTVTNTAAAKSRRKINRLKRENPNAFVAAVGCYTQMLDEQQRQALHVDLIVGASHKDQLASTIIEAMNQKQSPGQKIDLVEESRDLTRFESMPIGSFEGQHRAFLKIQDGCNQYCAYCQIPLARGPERSQLPMEVVKSAQDLAASGHLEIVLTGIHTGRYHFRDTNLTKLLEMLLENTSEEVCYRLSSIEITEVSDELLDLMAASPRILPHLHIPIQAGDDRTLARMKRPYTVAQFEKRLEQIRKKIPDISISTDVITGFVGESDEEFETTKQTLSDCRFSFLHVFPYSRRKGTAADAMTGFVDGHKAKARTDELLALSKQLRKDDMARFERSQMLIEREEPGQKNWYIGYTSQYHPARIFSMTPLRGRINVKMTESADERYTVVVED